jgi:hypothetical protein
MVRSTLHDGESNFLDLECSYHTIHGRVLHDRGGWRAGARAGHHERDCGVGLNPWWPWSAQHGPDDESDAVAKHNHLELHVCLLEYAGVHSIATCAGSLAACRACGGGRWGVLGPSVQCQQPFHRGRHPDAETMLDKEGSTSVTASKFLVGQSARSVRQRARGDRCRGAHTALGRPRGQATDRFTDSENVDCTEIAKR